MTGKESHQLLKSSSLVPNYMADSGLYCLLDDHVYPFYGKNQTDLKEVIVSNLVPFLMNYLLSPLLIFFFKTSSRGTSLRF